MNYKMKKISSADRVNGKELIRQGLLLAVVLMFMHHEASAAQAPVALGSTVTYGVLGAATVTSTGATIIYGDLGLSPGTAVTGSPGVTGRLQVSDPAAALAQSDLSNAYHDAAGRTTGSVTVAGDLGGQTLAPGLYTSASSLELSSGNLTLAGDSNAVWIFQMGSTLTTTTSRQVILSGGAQAANIFWQVGSSATIGVSSVFMGTILAAQSITMDTGATLDGRALAQAGSVTLDANIITVPQNANPAGTVAAWGNDDYGQTNMPAGLSTLTAVQAGESYTVALKNDGTVVAWGDDDYGQSDVPPGLSNVTAIAAGEYHTVALKSDGTVVAWGNDGYKQTDVPAGLSGVTAIAAGQWHTLVLKSDGTVAGWGADTYGQTDVPAGLSNVTAIAGGSGHSMALKSDGTVVAWGANSFFGQCDIPIGLSGVTAIAAGSSHSVALQSDGTVVAWGNNLFGQTAIPTGLTGVTAIAAGEYHTVALKNDGTVVAWGWNADGETTVPAGLGGVTAIAAGWEHTAALIGPIITTQPLAQTFALGGAVNLSVSVIGTGLSYQWQFNDTNISGATNSTLNLMQLSAANAGAYRVVVSSAAAGTVTGQDTILSALSFGNLRFYAGITLAGTVGQQFRVDYADVLTPGTTNWQVLETITLPFSPYLVIDPNSPGHTQRFYRAVPLL
jgi:hypothetical protein